MGVVNNEYEIWSLKQIQKQLADVGLYHNEIDGIFGEGSLEAFRRVLGGNIQVINPHSYKAKDIFKSLQTSIMDAGYEITTSKSKTGIDGIWGDICKNAFTQIVNKYIENKSKTKCSGFKFGSLSESRLKGINPLLIKVLKRALELSPEDFGIREGLRTVEQQRENIKKGVSQTMKSKHLTGNAVDIYPTVLPKGWQRNPNVWIPIQKAVKQAGDELGVKLRFGINWKNDPSLPIETKFIDAPHVELV